MAGVRHFCTSQLYDKIRVVALEVPQQHVSTILTALKRLHLPGNADVLLKKGGVKPVQTVPADNGIRQILLSPQVVADLSLPPTISNLLEAILGKERDTVKSMWIDVELDERAFTVEEIIDRFLPKGMERVSHFETVGHIAHLNLREEHQPWKYFIGEVVLAKNPNIRTVVTKIGNIKTQFRTFEMEVIAGDNELETCTKESGCSFKLDFSKVYWNSRLGGEHERLVSTFHVKDVICDMMAGIGPFAVPAALKGCTVYANDLNPESFKYLNENKSLNHVPPHRMHTYNLDGKEFVQQLVQSGVRFTQVIMNLPASAYSFLPVFRGLFRNRPETAPLPQSPPPPDSSKLTAKAREQLKRKLAARQKREAEARHWPLLEHELPWIHCYGFSSDPEPEKEFMERVRVVLGVQSMPKETVVWDVRDVAPLKRMLCISFPLPPSVAFADECEAPASLLEKRGLDEEEQDKKRTCTASER